MYDLSVIIPARNEEWLSRTVESVLTAARAKTEVIAVLDGAWANPPLEQQSHLTIIHHNTSIGQRAACNEAARVSRAKYLMKLDAHCMVGEGFDVKLIERSQPDWVQVPLLYNLRVFHWKCLRCNNQTDQGPQPTRCNNCKKGANFERVVIWKPKDGTWWQCAQCWEVQQSADKRPTCAKCGIPLRNLGRRQTDYMNFNSQLEFKYGGKPKWVDEQGEVNDTMSLLGACFFMERDRYWKIGYNDEKFGSWGQQGVEVACKTWLSGGRLCINKATWYSHLFRTQPGFGFPYPNAGKERAMARCRELWLKNQWPKQIYPLSWLVERFWPVPGWTEADLAKLKEADGNLKVKSSPIRPAKTELSKGCVYYTDSQLREPIATACRNQLQQSLNGHPLVSVSLAPLDFGNNITLSLERGYLAMFQQILAGLSELDTDIAFLCEHDVLYHPSHFDFTPPCADTFYYNQNVWKINIDTGHALFHYCNQVSGLCADRQLLIDHYRRRIERVEREGFNRRMGFEPGTRGTRHGGIDDHPWAKWMSAVPNLDIRHGKNLSPSRWKKEQFRNQKYTAGWTESDSVPGWGRTEGEFGKLLERLCQVNVSMK